MLPRVFSIITLPSYGVNDANHWTFIHIDDNLEKTCLSWIIGDAHDKMYYMMTVNHYKINH